MSPAIQFKMKTAGAHSVQTAEEVSPCRRLHGHTFEIVVDVSGKIKDDGMIIDFRIMKNIINALDHKTILPDMLNLDTGIRVIDYTDKSITYAFGSKTYMLPMEDIFFLEGFKVVTSENIALYIKKILQFKFPTDSFIVTVFESETSFARV